MSTQETSSRLLFLTAERYPTFRVDVAALFGKYLPRMGVFSDIVAMAEGEEASDAAWPAGRALVCKPPVGRAMSYVVGMLHAIKQLLKADTANYDAVQVRDMPTLAFLAALMARTKGLKFYYWMSFPIPESQLLTARRRGLNQGVLKFLFLWLRGHVGRFLLYRAVLPLSHHIFVQTEKMREVVAGKGVPREKMTAVPMGVDVEAIQEADLRPVDDEQLQGKKVVVYLGALDAPRQIETLFDAMADVKKRVPEVVLLLVGDTEDADHRAWLKEQAAVSGVEDVVVWTGWLSTQQAWRYVVTADVAVSPVPRSWLLDMGSPTKTLEYIALGVPVVVNDNPDQKGVVEKSGGGVCVPYQAEAFADAIGDLLSIAPDRRSEIMYDAKNYVFSERAYSVIAEKVANVYKMDCLSL